MRGTLTRVTIPGTIPKEAPRKSDYPRNVSTPKRKNAKSNAGGSNAGAAEATAAGMNRVDANVSGPVGEWLRAEGEARMKMADHRRLIYRWTNAIYRLLGMKIPRGMGSLFDKGEKNKREKFDRFLSYYYGTETFEPGTYWYNNADTIQFFIELIRIATRNRYVPEPITIQKLFRKKDPTRQASTWIMVQEELDKTDVSAAELRSLFEGPPRVEGGFPRGRPLFVPIPKNPKGHHKYNKSGGEGGESVPQLPQPRSEEGTPRERRRDAPARRRARPCVAAAAADMANFRRRRRAAAAAEAAARAHAAATANHTRALSQQAQAYAAHEAMLRTTAAAAAAMGLHMDPAAPSARQHGASSEQPRRGASGRRGPSHRPGHGLRRGGDGAGGRGRRGARRVRGGDARAFPRRRRARRVAIRGLRVQTPRKSPRGKPRRRSTPRRTHRAHHPSRDFLLPHACGWRDFTRHARRRHARRLRDARRVRRGRRVGTRRRRRRGPRTADEPPRRGGETSPGGLDLTRDERGRRRRTRDARARRGSHGAHGGGGFRDGRRAARGRDVETPRRGADARGGERGETQTRRSCRDAAMAELAGARLAREAADGPAAMDVDRGLGDAMRAAIDGKIAATSRTAESLEAEAEAAAKIEAEAKAQAVTSGRAFRPPYEEVRKRTLRLRLAAEERAERQIGRALSRAERDATGKRAKAKKAEGEEAVEATRRADEAEAGVAKLKAAAEGCKTAVEWSKRAIALIASGRDV